MEQKVKKKLKYPAGMEPRISRPAKDSIVRQGFEPRYVIIKLKLLSIERALTTGTFPSEETTFVLVLSEYLRLVNLKGAFD